MIRDDGTFNLPLSPLSDRILCICSVNHQLQRRRVHAHQSRHCHSQSQCGHAAPWPRRCRASFGTSVIASNTSDLYATFAAFTNGDASVTLLAGPAIELAIEASPVSQTLPPINISDPQDQVLLIASRQAVVEPTDENHDVNATQFPFGLEDLQFGFGPEGTTVTDIATFGVRQIKGTTVTRFFTQRTTQKDSFQSVIEALKNGDIEVGSVSESAYQRAIEEEPMLAFSARIVWCGPASIQWVIHGDLDEKHGAGTKVKVTQQL